MRRRDRAASYSCASVLPCIGCGGPTGRCQPDTVVSVLYAQPPRAVQNRQPEFKNDPGRTHMHPSIIAQTLADKPAIIMAGSGETVTFGEMDSRSNQGAQLFRKLGLKTGDGICIFMENNIRFLEICWAAQRSGLYFTAVS